jgi:hypothetical protein
MRPVAFGVASFALAVSSCVVAPAGSRGLSSQALLPVRSALLSVDQPFEQKLSVAPGQVELVWGQLPAGLSLDRSGWVRGTPTTAGELVHFTLRQTDALGRVVSERSYTWAVDSSRQDIALGTPLPTITGNALLFDGMSWSGPVDVAFAWDPTLQMIWPLRAGGTMSGAVLAPMGSSLTIVGSGAQGSGESQLFMAGADPQIDTVIQLAWFENADIDLNVLDAPEGAAGTDVPWSYRSEVARASSPGPEVISLSAQAKPGRYELIATKAFGDQVDLTLWLTIHRRDGTEVVQRRFDALFSDTATGSPSDEISSGRQSYALLGQIEVQADGTRRYLPPVDGRLSSAAGGGL